MFGFLLAVLFGGRMAYKWHMSLEKMVDVLIGGTFCGIIGARLYYVVFSWDTYKDNLLDIFKIWEGGLAIYGGIIGGILGAFIVSKVVKLNFLNLLDLIGMSLLIGQGIGRWGNFTNQEAFGTNTDLPWGMWSEKVCSYILRHQDELPGVDAYSPVHPTFLYESIWCLLGFGVLYIIMKKCRKFSGQLFLCYGIWYGTGRFFIESLRTDSLYITENLRVSQLLSLLLVIGCAGALVYKIIDYRKRPVPIATEDTIVPVGFGEDDAEHASDIVGGEERQALNAQLDDYLRSSGYSGIDGVPDLSDSFPDDTGEDTDIAEYLASASFTARKQDKTEAEKESGENGAD